ncbi:MAG: iron chelate uptake ABC transporter family permease subunit [Cellulosilyticaceae bacterium]
MKDKKKLIILAVVIVAASLLFIGLGLTPKNYEYFLSRRIPKVVAMLLTGGCIAFSSVVFQTITHNRILTPNVLGLDSVYVFIQTLIVFLVGGLSGFTVGSTGNFLLTLSIMIGFSMIFYKVLFKKEMKNIMFLVLMGMVMGTFFSSLSDGMQFLMDPNEFLMLQDSMFASFNSMRTKLIVPSAVLVVLAVWYVRKEIRWLDALSLGREQAINLGVDYDRVVKKMLIVIAVMVSVSTALVGPITFLGILVSNLARQMMKTYKHSYLISASVLISMALLIVGQFLIERVLGYDIMLSMIINLIGGVYFLYLLLKENNL